MYLICLDDCRSLAEYRAQFNMVGWPYEALRQAKTYTRYERNERGIITSCSLSVYVCGGETNRS